MNKDELLYALSKIEPRNDLKEQTKLKMMNIVMTRDTEKTKSPNFFRKMSSAISVAAIALVCVTTFGIQKFLPNSYVAEIGEAGNFSMVCENNLPSRLAEQPTAFAAQTGESEFKDFLSGLNEDYRAIGIEGEVISKEIFICNDENEYGIYGFAIINVKISDVFFSENEPFFGIKKGDTVSLVKYISSDLEIDSLAEEGSFTDFYAYSGKDLVPFDELSEKIGLDNAFVIFK